MVACIALVDDILQRVDCMVIRSRLDCRSSPRSAVPAPRCEQHHSENTRPRIDPFKST